MCLKVQQLPCPCVCPPSGQPFGFKNTEPVIFQKVSRTNHPYGRRSHKQRVCPSSYWRNLASSRLHQSACLQCGHHGPRRKHSVPDTTIMYWSDSLFNAQHIFYGRLLPRTWHQCFQLPFIPPFACQRLLDLDFGWTFGIKNRSIQCKSIQR